MLEHYVELVHHAYYCDELAAGRRAAEHVLAQPDISQDLEFQVRVNRTWYTQLLAELCLSTTHARIDVPPARAGWSTFNPTLLMHDGELIGIVRSSNYRIVDGRYVMPDADGGTIKTEQILVQYGAGLEVVAASAIVSPTYARTGYPVEGLEDCRLRHTPTGVGVSFTIRDAAPWDDGRCRIGTADLDLVSATLSRMLVLDGVTIQEHEKNWMPIEGRGGWLYACTHQGHVVSVDASQDVPGGWQIARRSPAPPIARRFRGGSQLVPWRGGHLACVHETVDCPGQRVYEHRLVWFDSQLAVRRVSPPFAFREQRAIEFAAGIAVVGGRVVVSYGVRDAEAWLCTITEDDCDAVLQDLDRDGLRAAG